MANSIVLVSELNQKIGNQVIADARRQAYQALKKEYKNKGGKNGKLLHRN